MKLTDVIRRPLITEKTSILREDGRTIVFQVAPERQQSSDQARGRAVARLESRQHPHQHRARQGEAAGPLCRTAAGLEEGLRQAPRRREDSRIPGRGVDHHADSQIQPDVARPAVPDRADVRRDHQHRAAQAAGRAAAPHRAAATIAGELTSWWRGGGHKRMYRIIDFKRDKRDIPAKVSTIEYDPNRSARIALLTYADGEKRYILQPVGLKVGDTIVAGQNVDILPGNCLPLKNIPLGTQTPQRGAEAGQGRPDRAQRRVVGAARRQGRRIRVGEDAVGRDSA